MNEASRQCATLFHGLCVTFLQFAAVMKTQKVLSNAKFPSTNLAMQRCC